MAARRPMPSRRLQGIQAEAGPGVTVHYAADELGNEAVKAARASDVAIVVVGNDPTCGPDMAHDWDNGIMMDHSALHGP